MVMLKHQDLTESEWKQKLTNLKIPQEQSTWMIVENHLECRLEKFMVSQIPQYCYRGRIFNNSGEWKWRILPGSIYRCVFLGERDWSDLSHDDSAMIDNLQSNISEIFLWGEYYHADQVWIEQKIPRRFQYTVEGQPSKDGRIVISIEEWQSPGQTHFIRYREIKNHIKE